MDNNNDFFGDVFGDPEDDPLLGGTDPEEPSSEPESRDSDPGASEPGAPSWMSDEQVNGHAEDGESSGTTSNQSEAGPAQKTILVDQRQDQQEGLDELNDAMEQGWRLVRITVSQSDSGRIESAEGAYKFVAVLEQEGPQSLFDFGAA